MATLDISDKTVSQDARDLFGALIMLDGSATWDAASIADGDEEAKDITVTGAGVDLASMTVYARVLPRANVLTA